jgi:hypothetical protein
MKQPGQHRPRCKCGRIQRVPFRPIDWPGWIYLYRADRLKTLEDSSPQWEVQKKVSAALPCYTCGAPKGALCATAGGHISPLPHGLRLKMAYDKGIDHWKIMYPDRPPMTKDSKPVYNPRRGLGKDREARRAWLDAMLAKIKMFHSKEEVGDEQA